MTKQELRKQYLQKRLSLSDAEYNNLNLRLCENFFKYVDLAFIRTIHTFLPIKKNKEPDTWLIIEQLQRNYPDITIAVPKINAHDVMDSYQLDRDDLKLNSWGIPEPVNGALIEPSSIDLVLVPLLAIDRKGHRVGYGKGYYDRFLSTCRKDCKKIGLSFFEPIHEIPHLFDHDHAIDGCLTPGGMT